MKKLKFERGETVSTGWVTFFENYKSLMSVYKKQEFAF